RHTPDDELADRDDRLDRARRGGRRGL
ncbi:MAG: hypothetical protein AVDCRST_MAG88-598, partial [uncultured Thermomicrobiales bacterium]